MVWRLLQFIFLCGAATNGAIFHYEIHFHRRGDAGEQISRHSYNVGQSARGDHSKIRLLQQLGPTEVAAFKARTGVNPAPTMAWNSRIP